MPRMEIGVTGFKKGGTLFLEHKPLNPYTRLNKDKEEIKKDSTRLSR
jgi:hypothetical protein